MLRHRASLVRLGTRLRNRIHAVVADFGYDRAGTYWTGPGRGWLAELDLPPVSREIVTDCLAVIDALAVTIDRLDGEVRAHAKAGPRVKTLTALPGAGQFTALMMLAEIGDITRFPNRPQARLLGRADPDRARPGPDRPPRADFQTGPGVAAVGSSTRPRRPPKRSPEFAATYAVIAKRRGDEDRHHGDRPQAAHPRLPPARRPGSPGTRRGGTPTNQEGHQAPGELAHAA